MTKPYTVADAFADARFPVPKRAKIVCAGYYGWNYTYGPRRRHHHFTLPHFGWEQVFWRLPNIYPNLANLPAKDAWEQLPEIVRDHPVVREKVAER